MVRGIGRASAMVVAIVIGCARTTVELDDLAGSGGVGDDDAGNPSGGRSGAPPTDDDDILGGTGAGGAAPTGGVPPTGGMPPTGGVGGSIGGQAMGGQSGAPTGGTGGSAGKPEPPLDPGGPIPNCRADAPVFVPTKDLHWIYLPARLTEQSPEGRYLVLLTPDGPRNVTLLSETGAFRGWSYDGRFMAFTRAATSPFVVEVLDFSQAELPVPVPVLPREGNLTWSPSDGRYALQYSESSTNGHRLAVVDASTITEKTIELPHEDHVVAWSPDGRYIALFGPWAVLLVDTLGPGLALHHVHAGGSAGLVWSPDGRYIAFQAHHSEGRTDRLYVFDTQSMTLDLLDEVPSGSGLGGFTWAGNSWLIRTFTERSVFYDFAATSRGPGMLAEHDDVPTSPGVVSPGGKCFVFTGYCEAASENGVCVRTLPPDPEKPAILVQRTGTERWFPYWAGTGDQLLLMTGSEPLLVNVELDGGDYTSQFVTAGTSVTGVRAPSWNPSRHSDWIQYFASDGPDRIFKPRLWHRERGDTYAFPIGDGVAQGTAWSTDSRYLVFEFGTASGSGVYFVQELIDSEPGASWILDEPIPAGPSLWPHYLQP